MEQINETPVENKADKKKKLIKEIISWVLCIALALGASVLLRTYVFELVKVDGDSMLPTLHSEQTLFVDKVTPVKDYKHGDIVIVHYPGYEEKAFVKRVVGLPGDTIEIKAGKLIRNGEIIEEDYIKEEMRSDYHEITVPENSIFVMGDNRNDSMDSRGVGTIDEELVLGRSVFIIWSIWEYRWLV